jgi:hypothetical protein
MLLAHWIVGAHIIMSEDSTVVPSTTLNRLGLAKKAIKLITTRESVGRQNVKIPPILAP